MEGPKSAIYGVDFWLMLNLLSCIYLDYIYENTLFDVIFLTTITFFFEVANERPFSVNGERYNEMTGTKRTMNK